MHPFPTDYDEYAPTYAWTRWAVPWVVAPLTRVLSRLGCGAAVLDVGCGTGNYLHALVAERSDIVYLGFDISRPMLREAAARPSRARFMVGDASQGFPCRDCVCGLVFAVDVIHHIERGRLVTLFSEAVRVLEPRGHLVLVTDSEDSLRQRSLTKFFPEILAIELQRYPPLAALHEHATAMGLHLLRQEPAEGRIPLSEEFLRKLEAKCSSAMRLLAPADHAAGIGRVREAQARGEQWLSCYTVLHYELKAA